MIWVSLREGQARSNFRVPPGKIVVSRKPICSKNNLELLWKKNNVTCDGSLVIINKHTMWGFVEGWILRKVVGKPPTYMTDSIRKAVPQIKDIL